MDVCIRNFSRRSIRIREKRRVAIGHIATGISDQVQAGSITRLYIYLKNQFFIISLSEEGKRAKGVSLFQISERVFTLETLQGQQVAHDEELLESGLELHCVPAPDFCPRWKWRVRDGALEIRTSKTFLDKILQIL